MDLLDLTRLRQLSYALSVGIELIFLGAAIALLGIEASLNLTGSSGGSSITVATASPGIILALGGIALTAACVLKPYTHSAVNPIPPTDTAKTLADTAKTPAVEPRITPSAIVSMGDTTAGIAGFWKSTKDSFAKVKNNPQDSLDWLKRLQEIVESRRSLLEALDQDRDKTILAPQLSYKKQTKYYRDLGIKISTFLAEHKTPSPDDIQTLLDQLTALSPA